MQPGAARVVKSKMAMETSTSGDLSSKKNHGRIPKRIHKAEREKMKREHLNESFLALASSLELSDQNNGKASVLMEATRTMKDMLTQVERLRKENEALLTESQYVTVEKSELKDENSALEAEIDKLRTEIKSRVSNLQLDLNVSPPEYHNEQLGLGLHKTDGALVFPLMQHEPQGQVLSPNLAAFFSNSRAYPDASKHISTVSKPHARYLTPADKWPSQVLKEQSQLGKRVHQGYRNSNQYAGQMS